MRINDKYMKLVKEEKGDRMGRILLCIDDTDDISKKTSTGRIAEAIADRLEKMGAVIIQGVTRHQLLLNEKISYTSHNSAMCLEAEGEFQNLDIVWNTAGKILQEQMADTACPGMALCRKEKLEEEHISKLTEFGRRAKKAVIALTEARLLAEESGIYLDSFGGTGAGQIGALAGIGLRLTGNDGTFRGKVSVGCGERIFTCGELKNALKIENIRGLHGEYISDSESVLVKKQVKLAFLDFQRVLVVKKNLKGVWEACKNADLYEKTKSLSDINHSCRFFISDNDSEEQIDKERHCGNCLYRRWTKDGIRCVRNDGAMTF